MIETRYLNEPQIQYLEKIANDFRIENSRNITKVKGEFFQTKNQIDIERFDRCVYEALFKNKG